MNPNASRPEPQQSHRLDVLAFAGAAKSLAAAQPLAEFPRVLEDCEPATEPSAVQWSVRGEMRPDGAGQPGPWLHLLARAGVRMVCQRCLQPLEVALEVDRWFRFVADEDTALAEDEDAEEDVLALSPDFDLHALIEDELVLALPFIPRHAQCPVAPTLQVADAGAAAAVERPHPFAGLAALKRGGGSAGH